MVASPVAASGVDNVAQLAVLPLSTNVTTTPPEQGPVGPNPEGKLIKYGDKELPGLRELERWLGKGAGVGPVFVKCECIAGAVWAAFKRIRNGCWRVHNCSGAGASVELSLALRLGHSLKHATSLWRPSSSLCTLVSSLQGVGTRMA